MKANDTDEIPEISPPPRCPVCARVVSDRELDTHLISEHAYLSIEGELLPRSLALDALWGRVFDSGDARAHERLFRLLGGDIRDRAGRSYAIALEEELVRRFGADIADTTESGQLIGHLRTSVAVRAHFWPLVLSDHPRIRELGRELILPELREALVHPALTGNDVRRLLDRLCPKDDIWQKIRVCNELTRFDVSPAVLKDCLRQLEAQRPIACPHCSAVVARDQLDDHLRHVHRIYVFQGVQRSLSDTIDTLVSAICREQPDKQAWELLQELAAEAYPRETGSNLAACITDALNDLTRDARASILPDLSALLAASKFGIDLAGAFAASKRSTPRQLALLITARLGPPLSPALIETLLPLLARRRAPAHMQIAAAAVMLSADDAGGPFAAPIVETLSARRGKARTVDRLRELEKLTGPVPALQERIQHLEARIRMRCPRCQTQLTRAKMADHLWSVHSLVLDGRRVREPWQQIEAWIRQYQSSGQRDLLERCRALAQTLEGEAGKNHVQRLLLARQVGDDEALREVLAEAQRQHTSVCPHCYELVPMVDERVPRPLNVSHGRLTLAGYGVEIIENGIQPRLIVQTPDAIVVNSHEPGKFLTRDGVAAILASPIGLAAVIAGALYFAAERSGEWLTVSLTALSLGTLFLGRLVSVAGRGPVDRAIDHAWQNLTGRMGPASVDLDYSTFLAGLALSSVNRGNPAIRAGSLRKAAPQVQEAVLSGKAPVAHLAALERLRLTDLAADGDDPVVPLVQEVARCFAGEVPLTYAQHLLDGWKSPWWTAGNRARLRVLLCDEAFEAGLELADVLQAAEQVPALAAVLDAQHPDGLAGLRLLWSLRATCPWARWGEPITVFDLARERSSEPTLATWPDLLLADRGAPAVHVLRRGINFMDKLFTEEPSRVEARGVRNFNRVAKEIVIDNERFRLEDDPAPVVKRLERWFRFFFHDLQPRIPEAYSWQAPAGTGPMTLHATTFCPSCRRPVSPILGQVGILPGKAVSSPQALPRPKDGPWRWGEDGI
jgi:hypothetical protein